MRYALILTVFLAGCSMPTHHWRFPEGRTMTDFQRDHRVCNTEAQTTQRNTFMGGRTSGQVDQRYVECMTALGYSEVALTQQTSR